MLKAKRKTSSSIKSQFNLQLNGHTITHPTEHYKEILIYLPLRPGQNDHPEHRSINKLNRSR